LFALTLRTSLATSQYVALCTGTSPNQTRLPVSGPRPSGIEIVPQMKLKIFYVGKGPLGEIDTTDFSTTVSDLKEKVAPMAGLQPGSSCFLAFKASRLQFCVRTAHAQGQICTILGSIQLYYAGKRLYEDTKLADCGFPGKAESITIICMPVRLQRLLRIIFELLVGISHLPTSIPCLRHNFFVLTFPPVPIGSKMEPLHQGPPVSNLRKLTAE
jgi:hypothetical protein